MHFSLLTVVRQISRRHGFVILWVALLPAVPGCEKNYADFTPCCPISDFRGCCWDEPLPAGGSYSADSSVCGGPTRPPIPACGQFPVTLSIPLDSICYVLREDTSAEPCVCTPLEDGCEPICVVPEPPSLPDACAGLTTLPENPPSCSATGNVVTYVVTKIAADTDSAAGFDLDGTEGSSCIEGALAVPDAAGGVDNSLASVDLSLLNRELFNRACQGDVGTSFQVDANVEEACATVTVLDDDEVVSSAALNLTGDCLSGTLDRFVLPPVQDRRPRLENVRLTATLDATGFSHMTLGATANTSASGLIFDLLGPLPPFSAYLDIRTDLDVTGALECDATSLTVELGGAAE